MQIEAVVECAVAETFRVQQVRGMFDLPAAKSARERFVAEVPGLEEQWNIGLVVGPSGSGKSTVARQAFGGRMWTGCEWPVDGAVVDGFGEVGIKEITAMLTAVGFSSPPGWVKPWAVLSNGEKFRCDLARAMLDGGRGDSGGGDSVDSELVVFDEFTSVVDRTVAKIGSAAVSKAIRSGRVRRRLVAVSCHYDIAEWLEPDWVLDMATGKLARGRLRRPQIKMDIVRVDQSAWELFRRHHYLDAGIHKSAKCFVGLVEGRPAVFTAVLHFPHPVRSGWREHRTVCLPDFQGVGLGNALSELVAGMFVATGKPYRSTTGHPAMMRYRAKSQRWRMNRTPGRVSGIGQTSKQTGFRDTVSINRITASFEYVGPARMAEARGFGLVA